MKLESASTCTWTCRRRSVSQHNKAKTLTDGTRPNIDVVGSVNTIKLDVVASVNTIRLRPYGWETSTEGSLRRKTGEEEKEGKEFQLAKPASLGSLASNQSVAWYASGYACKAVLGKETYGRLNGRKTGTSVP